MSTFPERGLDIVDKLMELVVDAHWDLGLDHLELQQGLDRLEICTHVFGIVGLLLLQALLVLLDSVEVSQEL